jgi:hypothetical protein
MALIECLVTAEQGINLGNTMKAHRKLARKKEFQSGIVIQPLADAMLIVQH